MHIPVTGAGVRQNDSLKSYAFLTTDIEGSTSRWDQQPDLMRAALARHDEILRAAITQQDGEIFKLNGDGFSAVFANPKAAILASISAQAQLSAEDFGALGTLSVRMAIDAGLAEARDGDYFGPPLNRVARLREIAKGGQILVSGVAAELAKAWLPENASLRKLSRHKLKGIAEPATVFDVGYAINRRARRPVTLFRVWAAVGAAGLCAAAGLWFWQRPLPQAEQQRELVQALAGVPCALLTVRGNQVTGIINDGAANAAFESALLTLGPHVRPAIQVVRVDGHFCPVLDTLASYHSILYDAAMTSQLTLSSGEGLLHNNQNISVNFTMPNYDGYVETDYFSGGSIWHFSLAQYDETTKLVFARSGQKFFGRIGVVRPPFDTDLLVVIVTPVPLYVQERPAIEESQSTYLAALNDALENTAAYGNKISIAAVQIVTVP